MNGLEVVITGEIEENALNLLNGAEISLTLFNTICTVREAIDTLFPDFGE